MKTYLNAEQKNQFMVLMSINQQFTGNRTMGIRNPGEIKSLVEQWEKSNNLTKDEKRSLKMVDTYLKKFIDSVLNRVDKREKEQLLKRIERFDFRLVDDFMLQKVYRDLKDKMKYAVVEREDFYNWCEQIMHVNCKNCTECWEKCELHQVFEDNMVPESTHELDNCRFAYVKGE